MQLWGWEVQSYKIMLDSGNNDEMDFNGIEMSVLMEANRKSQRLDLKEWNVLSGVDMFQTEKNHNVCIDILILILKSTFTNIVYETNRTNECVK